MPVVLLARLPVEYKANVILYLCGLNRLNWPTGEPDIRLVFGHDLRPFPPQGLH